MSLHKRLSALMEERQVTQSALAKQVGVTQQTIGKLTRGEARNSVHLHRIARALGTTVDYLTCETDDPVAAGAGDHQLGLLGQSAERSDDVEISHIDLRYGLGGTYLDLPIEEKKLIFPRSWLRQFTDAAPEHLCWAAGQGDSMLPTINHGEPILIDLGDKVPRMADMIWAVAYGEIGMVKRLRPLPDGSIELLSDNPNVPSARAVDGELHIIGRVVAVVKRL